MDCLRCKTANPELNKFCGQCGAPLDPDATPVLEFVKSYVREEVQSSLSARMQDQKVVEIEITEKVVGRLKELGKIVGIPLGLLAAFLSLWGIRSMSDVDSKIKEATGKALTKMNSDVDDAARKSVDDMKARINAESETILKQESENAKASIKSTVDSVTQDLRAQAKDAQTAINQMGQRLGTVESTVQGLVAAVSCSTVQNLPVTNIEECHGNYPNGCSRAQNPNYDAFLDSIKNRMPPPDTPLSGFLRLSSFVDLEHKTPSGMTMRNHEKYKASLEALGEGKTFGLIGYLYEAHLGSAETVNCNLTGEGNVDFHLTVGFDPQHSLAQGGSSANVTIRHTLGQTSVVAEMTPYYRLKFHPRWGFGKLSSIVGRQIKIAGQLMMDSAHLNPRDDCSFQDAQASCWRASVWELHPVTEFWVCGSDTPCSQEDSHWVKLENMP